MANIRFPLDMLDTLKPTFNAMFAKNTQSWLGPPLLIKESFKFFAQGYILYIRLNNVVVGEVDPDCDFHKHNALRNTGFYIPRIFA